VTPTATCPIPPRPAPAGEQLQISPDDARLVLQHFGHQTPGAGAPCRTGTFRGRLVALIAEADRANRAVLAGAYPTLVGAVQLARSSPTGIDTLLTIANAH
jgi:hypothetical protein